MWLANWRWWLAEASIVPHGPLHGTARASFQHGGCFPRSKNKEEATMSRMTCPQRLHTLNVRDFLLVTRARPVH